MSATKNRQISRDSVFVMAEMRVDGSDDEHRIKLRNLSTGGMMGEGSVRVMRGTPVSVNIRNVGWTDGTIAWVQDNRFGVAFTEEINPKVVRAPVTSSEPSQLRPRPQLASSKTGVALRKI